ncbi:hypothetical protein RND71_023659 [Anisodus tanguticus]|uniref:Uncharacterized protein n=1 Tax=Anisodus tanguticus TaxID=243964 RepID=A0AAE1RT04_9SOLA|nr:hypothetical protein RND71_023659 [Anisodus tanguticus]
MRPENKTFGTADGKQVRRTNSASPLGKFFDPGDYFLPVILIRFLGFHNLQDVMRLHEHTAMCGRDTFWFWVISAVPFYCSTWERYFTDTLILPVVNGPTEGLRLIYLRISLQLYSVLSSGLNSLGSLCHFHCLAAHDQDIFLTGRTYEEIPTGRSHFVADDSFLLLFQQSIASDSSNTQNSNSEEELTPFFSSLTALVHGTVISVPND